MQLGISKHTNYNKSYFESGFSNSGNGNIGKAVAIKMGSSYLVTEDLKDVFLYMLKSEGVNSNNSLSFTTQDDDPVQYQRIITFSGGYESYGKANIYYVPELKKGTLIKFSASTSYLIKFNETTNKGTASGKKISLPYLVTEDLHDVFFATCATNTAALGAPSFQVTEGTPIVTFTQLFGANVSTPGGVPFKTAIYYVPELKAGTVIKCVSAGYLFY